MLVTTPTRLKCEKLVLPVFDPCLTDRVDPRNRVALRRREGDAVKGSRWS